MNDRRVARDVVDGKIVSTVFLVFDHGYGGSGPLFYETMVFPDENTFAEIYIDRYPDLESALLGHEKAIKWVKDSQK